jgi:dihydroflavonol-4-reductase
MKVFVTGGTGFIGTHFVRRMAETEHQLVCLARKTSDTHVLQEVGARIVIGDLGDKQSLINGMQGCDWVVHLASSFELWTADRREYQDCNITGVRNVMESCLETGIAKVVHVSTVGIYGKAGWPVTEDSPLGEECASEYARTKRAGDEIAWRLYREKQLPLVVVYPSAVVGPDDPKATGRYLNNIARHRMPAQVLVNTVFPFVYVGDVCEGILRALEKDGNLGQKYILNACNMTWREANEMVAEAAGVKVPALRLPDALTVASSYVLTGVSAITGKPPLLDLSVDQVALMKQGCMADGSKAERELGLIYTPMYEAFKEAVAR